MIRVLSLGAGVQSTTMALMAAHGELGHVDCAIFADTQWEPKAVYEHLKWLMSPNVLPFPVHIVSAGNIREDAMRRSNTTGGRFAAIPWHMRTLDHRGVATEGLGRRQCSKEYKIEPVRAKVRELLGVKRPRPGSCELLIGISWDERVRRKDSNVRYITNAFPLLEKQMRRYHCLKWMSDHDYPQPPKSACVGCPFRSNEEWKALTNDEFTDAVVVDQTIRSQPGFRGEQFAHHSLVPLGQADLSSVEDRGQLNWVNECEMGCGL